MGDMVAIWWCCGGVNGDDMVEPVFDERLGFSLVSSVWSGSGGGIGLAEPHTADNTGLG